MEYSSLPVDGARENESKRRSKRRGRLSAALAALALTASACASSDGQEGSTSDTPPAYPKGLSFVGDKAHAYGADTDTEMYNREATPRQFAEELRTTTGIWLPSGEYACLEQAEKAFYLGPYQDATGFAEKMQEWGFDTVRLTLNSKCWLGKTGEMEATDYKSQVFDMIHQLNDRGIVAILRPYSSVMPDTPESIVPYDADAHRADLRFWSDLSLATSKLNVAYELRPDTPIHSARCYSNSPCLPRANVDSPDGVDTSVRSTRIEEIVTTIRTSGSDAPIIVSLLSPSTTGLSFAEEIRGLSNVVGTGNLAVGIQVYPGSDCASSECYDRELSDLAREFPLVITRFGGESASDRSFIPGLTLWTNENDAGWVAASARPGDGLVNEELQLTDNGEWLARFAEAS